jgi:chromosome segregation ATPase
MARAGILYSHVAAAAARLTAENKNPTVDAVREAMGATGSKSTIAPFLRRWKEAHADAAPPAGPGLPSALLEAVGALYDRMQAETTRQADEARQAHRVELEAAQEEMHGLRGRLDEALNRAALTAADLEKAALTINELRQEHHRLDVMLSGMRSDNAGLTQRVADRTAEVNTMCDQLTHARTQFEHYQEASAAQRSEERQSFESRISQQDQEVRHLRQQLAVLQTAAAEHRGQTAARNAETQRLLDDLRSTQNVATELQSERDRLANEASALAAARPVLEAKLDDTQQALAEARTQLAVLARELVLSGERLLVSQRDAAGRADQVTALVKQVGELDAELRLHATPRRA